MGKLRAKPAETLSRTYNPSSDTIIVPGEATTSLLPGINPFLTNNRHDPYSVGLAVRPG